MERRYAMEMSILITSDSDIEQTTPGPVPTALAAESSPALVAESLTLAESSSAPAASGAPPAAAAVHPDSSTSSSDSDSSSSPTLTAVEKTMATAKVKAQAPQAIMAQLGRTSACAKALVKPPPQACRALPPSGQTAPTPSPRASIRALAAAPSSARAATQRSSSASTPKPRCQVRVPSLKELKLRPDVALTITDEKSLARKKRKLLKEFANPYDADEAIEQKRKIMLLEKKMTAAEKRLFRAHVDSDGECMDGFDSDVFDE